VRALVITQIPDSMCNKSEKRSMKKLIVRAT
jgi:hypothetical protein